MLPKSSRFTRTSFPTRRPDQRHTFSWGTASEYESSEAKVAVVISKKVFPLAHDRARARRRVYEAARAGLKGNTNSFVIFPRRDVAETPLKTLIADLKKVTLQ